MMSARATVWRGRGARSAKGDIRMMRSWTSRFIPLVMLATAAVIPATPGSARADNAPTLTIDQVTLVGRVDVRVDVTYSCDPGSTFTQISVRVDQASGHGVNSAVGFSEIDLSTCNGSLHSMSIGGTAPVPFHGGAAAASGSILACSPFGCQSVNVAPESVRL
jgi:hypothetical protein